MRERRVGDDGVHLEAGIGIEHLLLALDDELVLEEAFDQALVERQRDRRVMQVVVVQVIPEEMRRAPRLGRKELADFLVDVIIFVIIFIVLLSRFATRYNYSVYTVGAVHCVTALSTV